MKDIIVSVLALCSALPAMASFTSPIPPPIKEAFLVSCRMDLSYLVQDSKGRQISYQSLRGSLELRNQDLHSSADFGSRIEWQKWDLNSQNFVAATLNDLPGQPKVWVTEFYAVGNSVGKIGYFDLNTQATFVAEDKLSRIGVGSKISGTVVDKDTILKAEPEAWQTFKDRSYRYSLEVACRQ